MEKTNKDAKKESAKKIRKKILTADLEKTHNLQEDRIHIVRVVQSMGKQIELLSKNEQEFFDKLIKEIKEIPKSAHDLRAKEQKVLEGLIETAAALKIAMEKEEDPEKKKKLEAAFAETQESGKKFKEETDIKPRSLKETLSMHYVGLKPRDVRKEGFRGAFKKESKNLYNRIFNPGERPGEMSFEDSVNAKVAEKNAAELEASQKDDSKLNDTGKAAVENAQSTTMNALLSEVAVIRKLLDGSIKRDPSKVMKDSEGNAIRDDEGKLKYTPSSFRDADTGKKISKEDVRTAGTGLYTKKELGESLGLTKSQIKEGSLTDIEKASAHSGVVSMETAALNKATPKDAAEAGIDEPTQATTADVVEKLDKIAELLEQGSSEGDGSGINVPSPRGGIASRFMGRAKGVARGAVRQAAGLGSRALAMGSMSTGAAGLAATGTVAVGGLAAGLAIGDQFNTSVEEGGSGNLSDWWRNRSSGGRESIAERESREKSETNADAVARQRGYSSFAEMRAANRNRQGGQPTSASPTGSTFRSGRTETYTQSGMDAVQSLQSRGIKPTPELVQQELELQRKQSGQVLEEVTPQPQATQPQAAPVITNITNNNGSQTKVPDFMPPVKSTDNSFLRYQDRRMTRVL